MAQVEPDDTTNSTIEPGKSAPSITIAGKEWPIPQLAPRQNRIVVPALLEVIPKIVLAPGRTDDAADNRPPTASLDTAAYDRVADIVFHALTRAHPDLHRSEFDDMPIDTTELFAALTIIARQAGLFKPRAS